MTQIPVKDVTHLQDPIPPTASYATLTRNSRSLTPRDRLEVSKRKEIEQIESVIDHSATDAELGFEPSKVKLVAGADRDLNLPSSSEYKVKLVAGVGFEPTTFRL